MCLSEREILLSLKYTCKSEPLFIKYEHNGWMTITNNVLFVTVISHLTIEEVAQLIRYCHFYFQLSMDRDSLQLLSLSRAETGLQLRYSV